MKGSGDLPAGGAGSVPSGPEGSPQTRPFPRLEARSLTGAVHKLPEDFGDAASAVLVGFEERHQAEIDSWLPTLEGLASRLPGLRIYELVLLQRSYLFARPMIDGGMAAGILSPEVQARTLTCYTDLPRAFAELRLPDARDAALFVVDGRGRVVWWASGGHDPGQAEDLVEALSASTPWMPGAEMPAEPRNASSPREDPFQQAQPLRPREQTVTPTAPATGGGRARGPSRPTDQTQGKAGLRHPHRSVCPMG